MHDDGTDPGIARAGASFAVRRRELGINQRGLADRKIITASSLIAFEKGRSWPRERTRATLEELVQWPAGTLAAIRAGGAVPGTEAAHAASQTLAGPSDEHGTGTDELTGPAATEASLIVDAIEVAITTVDAALAQLPADTHRSFPERSRAVLADLRRLDAIAARAVRGSAGAPEVITALAAVRRRYDALMARSAGAPAATVGQRLYTARRRANLSTEEAAAALGAPAELVAGIEADTPVPDELVGRIEALLTDLGG